MRKIYAVTLLCLFGLYTQAQSTGKVGIGTNSPNASAQLDITSTDKGLLIPRLTTAQQAAVSSPATGLLVFNTTNNVFEYFNGTIWVDIAGTADTDWTISGNDQYSGSNTTFGDLADLPDRKSVV